MRTRDADLRLTREFVVFKHLRSRSADSSGDVSGFLCFFGLDPFICFLGELPQPLLFRGFTPSLDGVVLIQTRFATGFAFCASTTRRLFFGWRTSAETARANRAGSAEYMSIGQ